MKSTRIATYCKWIFFLITLITFTLTNTKQAAAQTAIANPAGTTVTTLCTADTRAIGFPNGNTFSYANTGWPSCTAWGFPSTTGIPVCRANILASNACAWDNVTYNAAAPTNLAGGVMCFTGTTNYRASNGTTYADRPTNIRMVVTVTDNSNNPMQLQVSNNFVYVVIPDPSFTFKAKVELQAFGPASVVYQTTGNGTTVPIGCTVTPNNSYTCGNYLNTWVGAIQLYNCISTDATYKICTQFTGSTFLSAGVPVAPATPTGAATICVGGSTTLSRVGAPLTGVTWYWQAATNGTDVTNSGATYSPSPATTTTYYLRPGVGTCWGTASGGVTVTVVPDPTVSISGTATTCAGTSITLTATPSGGQGSVVTYNWERSPAGAGTWVSQQNTASATYATGTGLATGNYDFRVTLTQSVSGCVSVPSTTFPFTVNPLPAAPTPVTATPTTFCIASNTIQLNATAAGSTIYWYTVSTGGSNIGTSASGANFAVNPVATTTYYAEARVIATGCISATRTAVTVTLIPTPATPNAITGATTVCVGATTTLTSPIATGGNVTFSGGYRIHAFYSNGTLNIAQAANVEVLVVGGGGGGGSDMGGGGGGGGVISNASFAVTPGSYAITVGQGGAGALPGVSQARGVNGGNSVFSTLTAFGGGGGGSEYATNASPPGTGNGVVGSGGGVAGCNQTTTGVGTPGQGNNGGASGGCYYPGGGGGAGGAGSTNPANGGAGVSNSILGTAYFWGGGGGGAGYSGIAGNGGNGGGGGGGPRVSGGGFGGTGGLNPGSDAQPGTLVAQTNVPAGQGGANTGGGGGGGAHYNSNNPGGSGGAGIVVVRYLEGAGIGVWSSSAPGVATINASTGVVTAVAAGTTTISYSVTQGICTSTPVTTTVTVLALPAAPTAANASVCTGGTVNISATSAGNLIKWYNAASGGTLVGVTASGANLAVTPGSTTTYYAEAVANNPYATGGTETTFGSYRIHRFNASGTLTMVQGGNTEVLVVAGGGGGGSDMGGGGGAGGVIMNNSFAVAAGSFPITVGIGGAGAPAGIGQVSGTNGGNSVFSSLTAIGGGGGGSEYSTNAQPGRNGGSGGGCASSANTTFGLGTAGQGYNGGASGGSYWPSGGGGAGGPGINNPGRGGPGLASAILGTLYYFGGGGGGSGYSNQGGNGGKGGGGGGACSITLGGNGGLNNGLPGSYGVTVAQTNVPGGAAGANTGGGGGGGSHYNANNYGGAGGSGIVVVRYIDAGCSSSTRTPVTVTVNPLPTNITPTAVSSTICYNTSTNIQIAGSQIGVNYQLRNNTGNVNIGSPVAGTGGTISLPTGNLLATTTFNVLATNPTTTCQTQMTVTVTVSTITAPPSTPITGVPTVCVGGTTTLTGLSAYGATPPTGGTITYVGGDRIHAFTAVGTVNFTATQAINARVLVVAGGGGGGFDMGGGGGGGGVLYNASYAVPSGNTTVTVGGGGAGAPAAGTGGQPAGHQYTIPANNGNPSVFGTMNAVGGGKGGSSYQGYTPGIAGGNGGSGGGAGGYNDNAGFRYGGTGTVGQGNRGGNSYSAYYSGGGGGAGGVGTDGNNRANGGPGLLNDILGTAYYWGGGGGGAGYTIGGGDGGIGGGGGGAVGVTTGGAGYNNGSPGTNGCTSCWANVPGGNAGANTGGGGGAGAHYNANNKGGDGGSGIVVVRYPDVATGVWSTNNPGVATVSATGVVSGLSAGTASISYIMTNTAGCSTTVTQLVTVNSTPTISASSATPPSICNSGSSNLNATSAGNIINWYTVASGGTPVTTTASGANYAVTPASTTTYYAEAVSVSAGTLTQTFNFTGALQTFTVPTGITSLTIDAYGAQGGNNLSAGGLGGRAQGTLTVTPGQVINIYVGGQNGYNGGGAPGTGGAYPGAFGGGASDIRVGGTALANRVIVAGAGGGGGSSGRDWSTVMSAGTGGGASGGNASVCCWTAPTGGTQVGGGVTGISCGNCGNTATNGSLGQGGRGDDPCDVYGTGSGGGGGYYGGAGGEACGNGEPGAGGSSYTGGVSGGSTTAGTRSGNGQITLTWSGVWDCPSNPRTPVTVTVNPLPTDITPTVVAATICNGTGTNIQIAGSQVGVNYQLRNNVGNVNVGSAVAGTGGTINLPTGNLTATTVFNVLATDATTTCFRQMTGTVTVTVYSNLANGTFIYTNPTSCTTANGTLTVSGVSGGSGSYNYSTNSTNGSNGTWTNTTGTFTGMAAGSGQVWVRNQGTPTCPDRVLPTEIWSTAVPINPITAATASSDISSLCDGNIVVLTASNMAPGNGGNGGNTGSLVVPTQGAYSLTGANYLACNTTAAGLATGNQITAEAWVKCDATGQANTDWNGIVAWGNKATAGQAFLLGIKSNLRLQVATWGPDYIPTTGAALTVGVWTHIAATLNGNTVTTYINGNVASTGTTLAGAINVTAAGGQWLTIGCTDNPGRYFKGLIDNVRIWQGVRTQADIQADMYKDVPVSNIGGATLRANYLFNLAGLATSGGTGPTLNVAATAVYPSSYLFSWTGANDPIDNPAQSAYERVTVGPLQGIQNFSVTATTNPANACTGTPSNIVVISDFSTTPFASSYATSGSAQGITIPGAPSAGTIIGRPGGVTYTYVHALNTTTGVGGCTNWGLPTRLNDVVGVAATMLGATTDLDYVTGAPTDLANGIVAYRGTMAVPINFFFANGYGSTPAFNIPVQLVFTVRTSGGAIIKGDFISSGDIMFRIVGNFTVNAVLQGIPPGGMQYDGGISGGNGGGGTSCATISGAAGGTTYYSLTDIYDCLATTGTAPSLQSTFNFDKFPRLDFTCPGCTAPSAGSPFSICWGGTPASAFTLQGNTGSIPLGTSNCGGLSHSWINLTAGGTAVNGTWSTATVAPTAGFGVSTPPAIAAGATTAAVAPTGTTYMYTIGSGSSNTCYGSGTVTVTKNVPVADATNFPIAPSLTTSWRTGAVPAEWDPTNRVSGNDNWYDNRNWTYCVPDINTNAMIYSNTTPGGANYQPIIHTSPLGGVSPAAKAIKIDVPNSAILKINTGNVGFTQKLNIAQ